jgi:hypothetical protein
MSRRRRAGVALASENCQCDHSTGWLGLEQLSRRKCSGPDKSAFIGSEKTNGPLFNPQTSAFPGLPMVALGPLFM